MSKLVPVRIDRHLYISGEPSTEVADWIVQQKFDRVISMYPKSTVRAMFVSSGVQWVEALNWASGGSKTLLSHVLPLIKGKTLVHCLYGMMLQFVAMGYLAKKGLPPPLAIQRVRSAVGKTGQVPIDVSPSDRKFIGYFFVPRHAVRAVNRKRFLVQKSRNPKRRLP